MVIKLTTDSKADEPASHVISPMAFIPSWELSVLTIDGEPHCRQITPEVSIPTAEMSSSAATNKMITRNAELGTSVVGTNAAARAVSSVATAAATAATAAVAAAARAVAAVALALAAFRACATALPSLFFRAALLTTFSSMLSMKGRTHFTPIAAAKAMRKRMNEIKA